MKLKLMEFARAKTNTCKVCALPRTLLFEVEEGIKAGLGRRIITAWLAEQGYQLGDQSVLNHRRNHMTKKKGSR